MLGLHSSCGYHPLPLFTILTSHPTAVEVCEAPAKNMWSQPNIQSLFPSTPEPSLLNPLRQSALSISTHFTVTKALPRMGPSTQAALRKTWQLQHLEVLPSWLHCFDPGFQAYLGHSQDLEGQASNEVWCELRSWVQRKWENVGLERWPLTENGVCDSDHPLAWTWILQWSDCNK